ncbi:hypothetical protein GMA11_02545 [Granulicatella sp. zg-ZJ]|uniref:ABC-three component system protein n=1 Tax=Granulicatella sp. zg-ZJ TaxID=2678504 RepID=UPI0013CFFD70|nr:ABC-three component system protein [Granulicatella sp. zg-ZJ]NEW62266.1 hypothetical protein [Granulicatella sp. zg-ZJ]
MEFVDYAKGLQPYISEGKTEADYFVAIISNFLENNALDNCHLLNYKKDTQYRYMTGNKISRRDAQYVYDHRDLIKYTEWLNKKIYNSDSREQVTIWLTKNGKPGEYIENECQELLEEIILSLCQNVQKQKKTSSEFEESLILVQEIEKKIASLPKPLPLSVPDTITDTEMPYISQLFAAYGDAETCPNFCEDTFNKFPEYKHDFDDRRIEYFSAASIERSVAELNSQNLSNQFDILKTATFDNIVDTSRKKYSNGYEKMLNVMEKATSSPVENYILSSSPYWINGKIKKGVCHHLVNDGKLKWVKSND